jgi:hypothetical protein
MTKEVAERDIIQLVPPSKWAGCLAVVCEVREWGVVAYVPLPGPCDGVVMMVDEKRAYTRLDWDDFTLTGGKVSAS